MAPFRENMEFPRLHVRELFTSDRLLLSRLDDNIEIVNFVNGSPITSAFVDPLPNDAIECYMHVRFRNAFGPYYFRNPLQDSDVLTMSNVHYLRPGMNVTQASFFENNMSLNDLIYYFQLII